MHCCSQQSSRFTLLKTSLNRVGSPLFPQKRHASSNQKGQSAVMGNAPSLLSIHPAAKTDEGVLGHFLMQAVCFIPCRVIFLFYIATMDLKSCWVICAKLRAQLYAVLGYFLCFTARPANSVVAGPGLSNVVEFCYVIRMLASFFLDEQQNFKTEAELENKLNLKGKKFRRIFKNWIWQTRSYNK